MSSSSSVLPAFGLCCLPNWGSLQPVPLQQVEVECRVVDLCAEVTVKQVYCATSESSSSPFSSSTPLDCVYRFPLDENSAVCGFEAAVDGEVRVGVVKAEAAARADFERAVQSGQTAALLERKAENIFECSLGQLQPSSRCVITLTYVTQLDMEGRSNRLTFPMTIAPKYNPVVPSTYIAPHSAHLVSNAVHHGVQCDHCLTSPIIGPRFRCTVCPDFDLCQLCESLGADAHDVSHNLLKYNTAGEQQLRETSQSISRHPPLLVEVKPRSLSVTVHVTLPSPLVQITSPSHPTLFTQRSLTPHSASLHYSTAGAASLDADLVFLIEQRRCFEPRAMLELDPALRTAAVSLAFIPPPLPMAAASALSCEFVFLIDRSGSMAGSSIAAVRSTMQTLLRSLPTGCRFNIVGFGTTHHNFFGYNCASYTSDSLRQAAAHIEGMQADMGGTEIARPLLEVLTAPRLRTHPRQVFLLTDGQVSAVDALVAMVRREGQGQRLFTFGIGKQVDRSLCKRLAKAGHGSCEFVSADAERGEAGAADIITKVMRQLARAMQPTLTEVGVDWGALSNQPAAANSDSQSFLQCPQAAPAIFAGSRYTLYGLRAQVPDALYDAALKSEAAGSPDEVLFPIHITAHSNRPGEEGQLRLTVDVRRSNLCQGRLVQRLAARSRLAELEDLDADGRRREVVDAELQALALRYSLTSRCTSFVLVYPQRNGASTSPAEVVCSEGEARDAQRKTKIKSSSSSASLSLLYSGPPPSGGGMGPQPLSGMRNGMGVKVGVDRAPPAPSAFGASSGAFGSAVSGGFLFGSFRRLVGGSNDEAAQAGGGGGAETLSALVQLQSFDGRWALTEELMRLVRAAAVQRSVRTAQPLTLQRVQAMARALGVTDDAAATVVCLWLFHAAYAERASEWQLLSAKSTRWLTTEAQVSEEQQRRMREAIQAH